MVPHHYVRWDSEDGKGMIKISFQGEVHFSSYVLSKNLVYH